MVNLSTLESSNSSVGGRAELRGSTQAKRAHFILSFKVTDCLSTVAGGGTAGVYQTANVIPPESCSVLYS